MYDDLLKVAYEKSDIIVNKIGCDSFEGVINTQRIIDAVEEEVDCRIRVSSCSFKRLSKDIGETISDFGAMMLTTHAGNTNIANIVLNADKDEEFQRFSLVHELGHLITTPKSEMFNVNKDAYVVSTHIDYKVTSIPQKEYTEDDFLKSEQLANVFALRVLMPCKGFYSAINKLDSLKEVAKLFGLSHEAVISRIMLVG